MSKSVKSQSPLGSAFAAFKRNKFAMAALIVLGLLYLSAIFADFVAPYSFFLLSQHNFMW